MKNATCSLAIFVFCRLEDLCFALAVTSLRIPWQVVVNSDALLVCHFDMNNTELYAVKWYKDGHEFYRYVPRNNPANQMFLLPDVTIDLQNSSKNQVVLNNVTLASAGRYMCEVSAEAPAFLTVSGEGYMKVIALPDTSPTITGAKPWYHAGDLVRLNCSSGRSKPATFLTWYVNDEQATDDMLRKYDITVDERRRLETATLGLEFRVQLKHFKNDEIKLKCLASLLHEDARIDEDKENINHLVDGVQTTSQRRHGLRSLNVPPTGLDILHYPVRSCSRIRPKPIKIFIVTTITTVLIVQRRSATYLLT